MSTLDMAWALLDGCSSVLVQGVKHSKAYVKQLSLQLKFCRTGLQNPLKDVNRNFAMQTP
ncbi:MAG TPA: hypothetical protein VE977_14945 [Pyrinomonadaceae bacterium]|nr:hypothetical protein [Pyrinomonadaceae bacterium]